MVNGTEEEMKEIHRQIGLVNKKMKSNAQKAAKEKPTQDCVEMLQNFFSDDKRYIEECLQRDLSDIWF